MKPPETSLWHDVTALPSPTDRCLSDPRECIALQDLGKVSVLCGDIEAYRGEAVLLHLSSQLLTALAVIELDGVARSLILCPPGLAAEQLEQIIADTRPGIILTDLTAPPSIAGLRIYHAAVAPRPASTQPIRDVASQWQLFTSGTTGRPKAVVHSLASLTAPLRGAIQFPKAVWSTFYDIRRYGGLTILLRALLGGGSMVFSEASEAVSDFLLRCASAGVTHISGTPSHWRQALMTGVTDQFHPAYVRLSGEPADQSILDMLQAAFPSARVSHAFASTEAGVAFDVADGRAGFPAALLDTNGKGVELKIRNGTLHIRSSRTAEMYLRDDLRLHGEDGFVDTGDLVELRDGRYHFIGRREGLINVGGLKVYPEEIEAVINLHPAVRMSLVRARRSPITGALVVADIVIRQDNHAHTLFETICDEILARCRAALPAYKVPTKFHEVTSVNIAPSGKLLRANV